MAPRAPRLIRGDGGTTTAAATNIAGDTMIGEGTELHDEVQETWLQIGSTARNAVSNGKHAECNAGRRDGCHAQPLQAEHCLRLRQGLDRETSGGSKWVKKGGCDWLGGEEKSGRCLWSHAKRYRLHWCQLAVSGPIVALVVRVEVDKCILGRLAVFCHIHFP